MANAGSSRMHTAVANIPPSSTFTVCGNRIYQIYPWQIGNDTNNQALIVQLGGTCLSNPFIMYTTNTTNNTAFNGITVRSGSWLSFQNIQFSSGSSSGASSGILLMASNSFLKTILSRVFSCECAKYCSVCPSLNSELPLFSIAASKSSSRCSQKKASTSPNQIVFVLSLRCERFSSLHSAYVQPIPTVTVIYPLLLSESSCPPSAA